MLRLKLHCFSDGRYLYGSKNNLIREGRLRFANSFRLCLLSLVFARQGLLRCVPVEEQVLDNVSDRLERILMAILRSQHA